MRCNIQKLDFEKNLNVFSLIRLDALYTYDNIKLLRAFENPVLRLCVVIRVFIRNIYRNIASGGTFLQSACSYVTCNSSKVCKGQRMHSLPSNYHLLQMSIILAGTFNFEPKTPLTIGKNSQSTNVSSKWGKNNYIRHDNTLNTM